MQRFHESEQVLVHRVGVELLDPPPCAVIMRVYRDGESFLYNYDVEWGERRVAVRDSWLAPGVSLIRESPEFADLS